VAIQVRRIYEDVLDTDGARVLVERLWPRGVSKQRAHLDDWCKDVAPTTELREWYGHVPDRFAEFSRRYLVELADAEHAPAVDELRALAAKGTLTLLTAVKDPDISEAAVLAEYLRG